MAQSKIPVIDLFAGAGGLGLGAVAAGGDLRLSVDSDSYSCETLRINPDHPGEVLQADVTTVSGPDLRRRAKISASDPVVVIGGAPCQPFSKAAYWLDNGDEAAFRRARSRGEVGERLHAPIEARADSRRTLVSEYMRLVLEVDAEGFVFENVPSILHPRNKAVFEALEQDAEEAGYRIRRVVATAAQYGAAQNRQRVFLLGSKRSIPDAPSPTHGGDGLSPVVTAGEAIGDLDRQEYAEEGEVVSGRWAQHLREIPPGMNYKHHTEWAGHPSPTFEAETRYWNFLLKLSPDKPSWTIPASPGPWTGPFHWSSRRLRVRELAALQSFPVDYSFAGPRREQVRQIGNAVPSVMGAAMVASVISAIGG
ncbi:DNA cytosine methyltransferase [Curtobacterium sp. SP.BCo]|uniref:DNA cytosine methyltransferase n=1 Tax=Curtobacterium sp. SP.BCo TaxID=3435229 RepID=UPI003F73EE6C